MKKLLLSLVATLLLFSAYADEGMWIPSLIGKNYDEMQRLGLRLSADDLYSINHASLKDAVVQFGGGCTAEMISPKGLVLTNHHCGYDAIASQSTVERDLLDNGFWAHNLQEELPAPGVTVLFLQRIADVTDEVTAALGNTTGEEYNKRYDEVKKKIEDRENKNGKLEASVKSFFNGNQFLVLIYKRYTDVRLVGNPPKSLGKFGGDTDNWMWPRHTCDFSMFRVYADANNEPANYSSANVPYKPKKYLPISIKGEHEDDYAMIFGYPGRTNRYEISSGVSLAINEVNPAIVAIRDLRLSIMRRHMDKDKAVYLRLTSLYSRIANYWKYYIGQTEQLKRLHVVDKKEQGEAAFTKWENEHGTHGGLMDDYKAIYANIAPDMKQAVYYSECFRASALARLGASFEPLYNALEKGETNQDTLKKYSAIIKKDRSATMKDFDYGTEKDMLAEMTKMYHDNIPGSQLPGIYEDVIFKKFGKDGDKMYADYADYVFKNTVLLDSNKFNALCNATTLAALQKDPAIVYAMSFVNNYTKNYKPKIDAYIDKKDVLSRTYLHELMQWKKDKLFYPDANSTMRISYGKVLSYDPQDGVHYKYYTTLDGLMAKYKPGSDEFDVPQQLIDLYNAKDYGQYADEEDGKLHTDFITNNDITGGNSGSPVMNDKGELIGAAFDGNWEAMSGDIAFDKKYKRTIVCDIRYILFVIDKMGHADNLIKEMDIRN